MFLLRSNHKAINNVTCDRINIRVLRVTYESSYTARVFVNNISILTVCLMLELIYKPGRKGFCEVIKHGSLCSPRFCKAEEEECFSKENLLRSLNYDMAAKKRKKDLMNNNSKVPCESKTRS